MKTTTTPLEPAPIVTFEAEQYPDAVLPSVVRVGDITGEGAGDVVLADFSQSAILMFDNLGDGTFSAPRTLPVNGRPFDFQLVDLNADGSNDLAAILERRLRAAPLPQEPCVGVDPHDDERCHVTRVLEQADVSHVERIEAAGEDHDVVVLHAWTPDGPGYRRDGERLSEAAA